MERTAQAGLDRLDSSSRFGGHDHRESTPSILPIDAVNDVEGWEKVYAFPIKPVTELSNPVALAVAELTDPGDVVLETGCGSAEASAELALSGRVVELGDFSPKILERARALFRASNLPEPRTSFCDLTATLPWPDRAVDAVWSSGVLEHWTDEELRPILREQARIARKRVISLVPYAGCVLYRLAKHLAEKQGTWPYGREMPRQTLRHLFEEAGLRDVREFMIWPENAPGLLNLTQRVSFDDVQSWWESLPADDPVKQNQGYLLVTVGTVAS